MMENGHEIFVCYSKWQQKEAMEVVLHLEAAGIKCWIMSRDIDYAKEWDEQVDEAIRTAAAAVYLEPEERSSRLEKELGQIKSFHIPVMTFNPAESTPGKIADAVQKGMDEAREKKEKSIRIVPYDGGKPFIFVSYSHKDMTEVFEIIRGLQKRGYRIWFDEGIDPGTEWDEYIASHINESHYLIAFLSENYFASSNCRDELAYARDMDKPLLLIYIRDEKMPQGMQLRLNRLQAIHWYSYEDKALFFQKVDSAMGISECRSTDMPEKED